VYYFSVVVLWIVWNWYLWAYSRTYTHPLNIFTYSDHIHTLWAYSRTLNIFTSHGILLSYSHTLTIFAYSDHIDIFWLYSHIHILWPYSRTLAIFTYSDYIHILWELKSLLVANNNSIFLQYLICLISGIRNITCLESCVALVDLSLSRNEVLYEERRSVCVCVCEGALEIAWN
jgi:hypothetical protein